jgi:hypothetical protein
MPENPTPAQPATNAPRRIKPKIGLNVVSCWVYLAILFAIGASLVLYLIAETGIVGIPFFSRFYAGPIPVRTVDAKTLTPQDFENLLARRLFEQSASKRALPYVVKLTEIELTGALRSVANTALSDEKWRLENIQLAVEPTDIEMLARVNRSFVRLDFLIRFKPRLTDSGVVFEPLYVQLGDYLLPPHLSYQMLGVLFSRDFGAWVLKFGEMAMSDVHLSRGFLELTVSPVEPKR